MAKIKKPIKVFIGMVFTIIIVLVGGLYFYVNDYYKADSNATSILENATNISVDVNSNYIVFTPKVKSEIAIIFYPGGKVEHTAYIPLLNALSNKGITCILSEMPFNLAVFDQNAADKIINDFPDIKSFYMSGHSLGGAMASSYTSKNPNKIKGVILLGSYIYGDIPFEKTLTIYGSEDNVMDKAKVNYTENVVIINGGNHAQFGNYGTQKGDGTATITTEEQQRITTETIITFINNAV